MINNKTSLQVLTDFFYLVVLFGTMSTVSRMGDLPNQRQREGPKEDK